VDFAPHQQRVIDELRELTEKVVKLGAFFGTTTFLGLPDAEKVRLRAQAAFMAGYQDMLRLRIEAFTVASKPQ